jgi:hypothetical protein
MRNLLEDPVFRAYMKTVPPKHQANNHGEPWQLWVRTAEGKWRTKNFTSYRDVWPVFVAQLKAHPDVTITSRRVFYAPPGEWYDQKVRRQRRPTPDNPKTTHVVVERRWRQLFHWDVGLEWCGRCRRPSSWIPLFPNHHALRRQPTVTPEDNLRCVYCGIRWIAVPDVDQMVRPSAK